MEGQRSEVHSRGTRIFGAAIWSVAIIATLGGMFDPTAGPDEPQLLPGLFILMGETALLVRALRLGVTVRHDGVVSRGWLRTRTFPRNEVTGAGVVGYSGIFTRGVTSGFFLMLTLKVADHTFPLPHIAGRAAPIRQLAERLQTTLGLPPALQRTSRNPS